MFRHLRRIIGRGWRTFFGPLILALALVSCAHVADPPPAANGVPSLDHIVLVIMENHSYDDVRRAPYTAGLIAAGASCSNMHAVTHPSQPNYLALWSGSPQGVRNDACPPPGSPYGTENLGHACEALGIGWRSYSEALPSAGWPGCSSGSGANLYVRKHCPWTDFNNLNHANERPWADLAADIAAGALPRLAIVIPDQCHNTHDCAVSAGDAWLAQNLPALIGAVGPEGMVVLTWDEDDNGSGNQILTVFSGPPIKPGFVTGRLVDHYALLRTLCEALGVAPFGAAADAVALAEVFVGAPTLGAPALVGSPGPGSHAGEEP